ncbi:ABC transporter ATP-binding protein [Neobacillus thermocopriae]|uniref:ABC transporter ATP-binding protein n=1 Tax=Neobacillus thermocopriae TaxID=1215031 RepID=A0A6B3TP17_9BACI|nr:ABC transporter ATP-binding protein [Neobacillus thermocopriae]MED3624446.1 ABC transporter ATP-binding protein [Neobacillus thermocopriae]MED3714837.1 ABC transporter ATP-binding protein [Neobacillus thermocopriae]NEX78724.1 ABC transporter ATP-binding protein [Neobacillus thermocopriae]
MPLTTTLSLESNYQEPYEKQKVIELKDVCLQYSINESPVLKNIGLSLYENEFVCVLGPSGCGKSSLLNIIAGFQKPTTGEVSINGVKYSKPTREIGVVFQKHNLFPWMKIKDNVSFGLKMQGVAKKQRESLAEYYINLVQLESVGDLLPHQLSGGMQQRASIARTLAANPKVILMDEPFSALDAITKETMQQHLISLWQKTKKTIFFITHDVNEALILGTRILVMQSNPGRVAIDMKNPLNQSNKIQIDFSSKQFQDLRTYLISTIKNNGKDDRNGY